jgi:hypothetical protein
VADSTPKKEHVPVMRPWNMNGHPISCFGQPLIKPLEREAEHLDIYTINTEWGILSFTL